MRNRNNEYSRPKPDDREYNSEYQYYYTFHSSKPTGYKFKHVSQ